MARVAAAVKVPLDVCLALVKTQAEASPSHALPSQQIHKNTLSFI
jgi:hypothetical protein